MNNYSVESMDKKQTAYDYDPITTIAQTPQSEFNLNRGDIFQVAKAFSESSKKDIADVTQVLLPTISAAAQKHYAACYIEDWRPFPISIYTLTFSESGNGKTRLVELVTKEIVNHDIKEGAKFLQAIANGDEIKNPTILTPPSSTIQAIANNIKRGRTAQAIITGEAGRFFGSYSFIPENISRTATDYADMWSGAFTPSEKASDSKADGVRLTGNMTLSLMGQAETVLPFFNNQLLQNSGLLARFLTWQSQDSFKPITQGEVIDKNTRQTIESFHSVIEQLLQLDFEKKQVIKPDKVATKILINTYNTIGKRGDKGGDLYAVRAFANRFAENAMRIATNIAVFEHYYNHQTGEIIVTAENVTVATELMDSYLREFQRLRADGLDTDKAKTALVWYERMRQWETKARTKREQQGEANIILGNDINRRIKDGKEKQDTVKILLDHGYLMKKPSNRGAVYEINMTVKECDRLPLN